MTSLWRRRGAAYLGLGVFAAVLVGAYTFSFQKPWTPEGWQDPLTAPPVAIAQTGAALRGWGWSSNIGWVRFNSEGATPSYGVFVDPVSGAVSGYAWSSNIGWIAFGTENTGRTAQIVNALSLIIGPHKKLTGWARAIAADGNGWDGWIKLASESSDGGASYGAILPSLSATQFEGYAWGDDVVGWLSLGPNLYPGSVTDPCTGVCVENYTYSLTVTKNGTGSGTVTGVAVTGTNINCGATCSASYPSGTSVTLTAAPATGSEFAGWSGDCTGTSPTCTITMSEARSVTATFNTAAVATYPLTVIKSGTGSGTVTGVAVTGTNINCGATCSASYPSGTSVTLTAAPATGSEFAGWSGDCTGTSPTCVVIMGAPSKSVTATFNPTTVGSCSAALSCEHPFVTGARRCGIYSQADTDPQAPRDLQIFAVTSENSLTRLKLTITNISSGVPVLLKADPIVMRTVSSPSDTCPDSQDYRLIHTFYQGSTALPSTIGIDGVTTVQIPSGAIIGGTATLLYRISVPVDVKSCFPSQTSTVVRIRAVENSCTPTTDVSNSVFYAVSQIL